MTATTVPPPGWNPIGAPELRANTRRFFSTALALSEAGHLVVLATVLWIQSRAVEPELRLNEGIIRFIPAPPLIPEKPPAPRNEPRTAELPPENPEPIPAARVVVPKETGPIGGEETTKLDHPVSDPGPTPSGGSAVNPDPAEGVFVAFDRAPVPYYQPSPVYPQWPKELGIEGRVVLHVLVGRDGRVARITVLRDVKGLTDAARDAIARWLFHPAPSGNNPVAVWVEIPIEFRL